MNKPVTVCAVGLNAEMERRISMATRLLGASGIDATSVPWDGTRRDVLVANLDDAYASAAVAVALRRGDTVVAVSHAPIADSRVLSINGLLQTAELTKMLRELLLSGNKAVALPHGVTRGAAAHPRMQLLSACIEQSGAAFLATTESITLVIGRETSRVMARRAADFDVAAARLLAAVWIVTPLVGAYFGAGDAVLTQSLDAFLIRACESNEQALPALAEQRHRLSGWPDLGALPENTAAMRLASALVKRDRSPEELSRQCNVTLARANAFCWAMRAAGMLVSGDAAKPASPTRRLSASMQLIVERLGRRFGLRSGVESSHE